VRFNPVNLVGLAFLILALICAWVARSDLARGETKWFGWSRLAAPASRRNTPIRYWAAMLLNILFVLLFALAGAFAMRAGLFRLGRI
jgi:ABC-type uncharacterized transport system permease subunit